LAHVLGYLGKINKSLVTKLKEYGYNLEDVIGYTGVEEYMDRFLRSESGGTQIQVDSRNRPVSLLGFKAPLDGQDVTLTIDIRMQQIVDRALEGYKGSIIILNPNTGEILAMASSPNFNPNVLIEGKDTTAIKDILNNPSAKLLNRAISGAYEPASTFKLVLAVVALERNMIDVNKEFDCGGVFPIGNREFKCDHVHGYQNLENAIAHSCNIYFYRLGLKLGPDLILEYARKLGYGQKTGIDLPYESNGFVLNYMSRLKKWYPGDTANLSIGQGETLVTPLQAVRFISVFANQGKLVKPFIVKSVGQVEFNSPSIIDLKLREKTLSIVRHALLMTVLNSTGTANILNISGLKVAGKTGTAQAASHKTNAWFLGFAPFMNPRISFCVFLENGGSSYYATVVTKYILTEFMKEGLL
jgi:penicillin-binding protein 2